jgi:MFS family permease
VERRRGGQRHCHIVSYLLVVRVFLGAMAAAAAPTIATLVGDFFPPQARARAYGTILGGELVGVAVGFLLSAEISVALGWRWSLYLTSTLGIAVTALIWFFLIEPARGSQSWIRFGQQDIPDPHQNSGGGREQSESSPRQTEMDAADQNDGTRPETLARDFRVQPRSDLVLEEEPAHWPLRRVMHYLLHVPTYVLLIIASTLGYYFFAGVRAFAMLYLTQHFHVARGFAVWLAAIVGAGALAGVLTGGRISERLLDRGRIDARIIVPGLALLIAAVFLGPGVVIGNAYIGIPLLTLGFGALAAANPPIDAARLDVVPSALWGRGEAGRMSLRGLLEGGAPILFGAISDLLGGGGKGLEWTFLIMLCPLLVAASLAIPASRTYQRDVATADASVRRLAQRRGNHATAERCRTPGGRSDRSRGRSRA